MIQASFLVVHWDFFLQGCYTAQKFSLQFYTSCSITSSSYLAGKWHKGLFKKTKMTSIVCIDECTVQNNGLVSSVVQSDYVTLLKKKLTEATMIAILAHMVDSEFLLLICRTCMRSLNIHCEAKKEPIVFCVCLFKYLRETADFFHIH